ncbi:hypothetical protein ONZ51_g76 [Trametes cubensis]|uniref:Golgi apparatus membrane protein TVP38 n=1 Tax=Trametes cubensis TaxID=1111947 RepID=A0AAD7U673_9APHY|nr:hypothetical protein ONZ51_g76 [Trametes cubensis]
MAADISDTYTPHPPRLDGYAHDAPGEASVDARYLTRTPSPTPSEAELLSPTKKRRSCMLLALAKLKDPKELIRILITLAIIGAMSVFFVYQRKIALCLRPYTDWMVRTPGGWLIPIALLIVLSFPPLLGHEIVAVLCGDAWGIGIGFAIVAAGTLLGERAPESTDIRETACSDGSVSHAGGKMETKSLQYAFLAEAVRQGGLRIAVIVRLSGIPGHLTTTLFATCGMNILVFLSAAILSLSKQLVAVYIGAIYRSRPNLKKASLKAARLKAEIIILTILVAINLLTFLAMYYIRVQTEKVKETVIYRRRKARQAKLEMAAGVNPDLELGPDTKADDLHPTELETKTVDADDAALHVPNPQHPSVPPSQLLAYDARLSPSCDYQQQPIASGITQSEKHSLELPERAY